MKIDLFTFLAQIINFLVLAALLYVVLFRRIIAAMEKRQKNIEQQFA
ncbi:MAG: F0F1 ATP synthase subunit B, partial [Elusimicrobia bacterium]|nr:F0F1 ATP synthase subunit B [Elusimicrobiota bacterium]MBD3411495.1 F0F1 ATP synthase subunit B [Elusimicrobiota bacterium]